MIFNTGLDESGLQFLFLLDKILKGKNLNTLNQCYAMTNNIMTVEAIQVFKHKSQAFGNKTMTNYELIMQGLMTHLFPLKALRLQKRYLPWVLLNPR